VKQREIPEEVRAFIAQYITSVEQLEVLLLARGSPDRTWTAEEVSAELRTAVHSARARLADLADRSLLKRGSETYSYVPEPDGVRTVIDRLAQIYATHRYTVIDLIFAKPVDNILVFANAFRLRKEEDDG
jgi:hypothetical protein